MTRQNKKSVGLTILATMLIAMALGFTNLTEQNQADVLVHKFGDLEAEILKIPNDAESFADTTDTMQTGKILSHIEYIEAFDEVIRTQIL